MPRGDATPQRPATGSYDVNAGRSRTRAGLAERAPEHPISVAASYGTAIDRMPSQRFTKIAVPTGFPFADSDWENSGSTKPAAFAISSMSSTVRESGGSRRH